MSAELPKSYMSTEEIESNYFTKALQRQLFHTHCKKLVGLDEIDENMFYKKDKN